MKASLKAFMKGLIDYAGLFPPAGLPLDAAIQNYAKYNQHTDAWMLSRFIIPSAKLQELSPYADELFSTEHPFAFSVLGKGTETIAAYQDEIDHVLEACQAFNEHHPGMVNTDMLEMKLPKEAAFSHDVDLLCQLMDETAEKLSRSEETPSYIFYEGFLDKSWKNDIEAIMQAIGQHNEAKDINEYYQYAAFKMRCGGVKAHQFPTLKQVAFILNKASMYDVAMKCTAGLHHPVRHYDEAVQTKMHGFFNVFGGGLLSRMHDLSDDELEKIIYEEDTEQFVFTDKAFSWKDYSITTSDIKNLRRTALLSYGSCSFNDPRTDLQKLKLL